MSVTTGFKGIKIETGFAHSHNKTKYILLSLWLTRQFSKSQFPAVMHTNLQSFIFRIIDFYRISQIYTPTLTQ